jgi:hypothetical protein
MSTKTRSKEPVLPDQRVGGGGQPGKVVGHAGVEDGMSGIKGWLMVRSLFDRKLGPVVPGGKQERWKL